MSFDGVAQSVGPYRRQTVVVHRANGRVLIKRLLTIVTFNTNACILHGRYNRLYHLTVLQQNCLPNGNTYAFDYAFRILISVIKVSLDFTDSSLCRPCLENPRTLSSI